MKICTHSAQSWYSKRDGLMYCQDCEATIKYDATIDRWYQVMTAEDALAMRKQLEEFYGERVARASEYCQAFEDWFQVAAEYIKDSYPELHKQLGTLRLVVEKSAALNRFVYLGERPRTQKCPKHQGSWSGCHLDPDRKPCECTAADGNVTGWLPEPGQRPCVMRWEYLKLEKPTNPAADAK